MRYESRHTEIKANAVASSSTVNLLKTIGLKQVLKMCHVFNNLKVKQNINFQSNAKANKVFVNGTAYSIGTFIVTNMSEPDIEFGEIIDIQQSITPLEPEEGTSKRKARESLKFTVKIYDEFFFDDHYMVYVVKSDNQFKVLDLQEIPCIPPVVAFQMNEDCHWIIPRYKL